jgi:hypothetical protein
MEKEKYIEITSQEIYDKEFSKWKKKLNEIKLKNFIKNPTKYITSFEEIIQEGVNRKLISQEWANKKIERLHKEINSPTEFKMAIKEKILKAKEIFKRKNKKI